MLTFFNINYEYKKLLFISLEFDDMIVKLKETTESNQIT